MGNLPNLGRIFYGIAIAAMGFLTIYYHDFPYMMIPPRHSWLIDHQMVVYLFGAFLFLAGAWIVIDKKPMSIALLLGTVLLLIFCFYFIPYELFVSPNSRHFGAWENSAKELALSAGAFVVAGRFPNANNSSFIGSLRKLIPLGVILYALTIISFGVDHFVYGKGAADYIPSWIPAHLFWIYLAGAGLLASGIAILLNIMRGLAAFLLGSMIFIWVLILHIPKAVANPNDSTTGEVTSALLALAYCGIAFIISAHNRPFHSRGSSARRGSAS